MNLLEIIIYVFCCHTSCCIFTKPKGRKPKLSSPKVIILVWYCMTYVTNRFPLLNNNIYDYNNIATLLTYYVYIGRYKSLTWEKLNKLCGLIRQDELWNSLDRTGYGFLQTLQTERSRERKELWIPLRKWSAKSDTLHMRRRQHIYNYMWLAGNLKRSRVSVGS